MNHKVGIWIDHKKAVIVSASADGVTVKAHSERSIGIETTDKLTDPQIVAKVKEHFGIAR